ncbi:glycosyltransferase [uncultured Ruminococcus sp.]|uniref:glycosyltransferase n=1 Tax=uncultured Ruminococcus sp. TaxID=165186 RepID=UPI0025CF684A|nr:glycosyltransferase [uncultured Ruminococcus sp.]
MASYSIVICTYNGQKTISQAIDAILALHLYNTHVKEVLIVDNASTDNTKKIIEDYIRKNSKIKYIYESKPGLSHARRRAVEANGDWVIYVDDDNILDQHWLDVLEKVIVAHPDVGVINGAVIAVPTDVLSLEEECRLSLMYRNLACTHIGSIDYPAKENKNPMGAGMCIPTHVLREISQEGWLDLLGRTGENLSSGEDTELCNKVFGKGYTYICDYRMRMQHLIPKSRLSQKNVDRLLEGLITSRYQLISSQRYYLLKRIARGVKYVLVYLCACFPTKDNWKNECRREKKVVSKVFIKCLTNDKLFCRKFG